jgi:hypothetical protein
MARLSRFFLLLVITTVLVSCGTVSVVSKPSQQISRSARIAVVSPASDPQNIAGQLEHLLLAQDFEVTSEAVGRSQIEYKEANAIDHGTSMTAGTIGAVRRLPANLVFRFSYNAYFDVFYWSFTRFNGTVVDLENGAVVASVAFSGDRSVSSVLEDFVRQLVKIRDGSN